MAKAVGGFIKAVELFNIANQLILVIDTDKAIKMGDVLQSKNAKFKVIGLGRKDINTPKNRMALTVSPLDSQKTIEQGERLALAF